MDSADFDRDLLQTGHQKNFKHENREPLLAERPLTTGTPRATLLAAPSVDAQTSLLTGGFDNADVSLRPIISFCKIAASLVAASASAAAMAALFFAATRASFLL
mmetsp:Transcript_31470/g.70729  ORF Transcript_31470/g.70729 Transcript_31470/m.70729 type:complete len:104 (+) Transcript_31470:104-415(+)|eukprot:CAMPEP_0172647396 /NCGR_PEP_ID=MMETSP1068-20121228/240730_1 /TAXON_ID=35684 /ORGANISM="Pseudopedinella elastica, Strain CCMP716" /LENGTH=103 /DNA_ID=CAMNT_0013461673 /DNA_START=25 /DNA_END=336 /DNA_ORIENTATION=+